MYDDGCDSNRDIGYWYRYNYSTGVLAHVKDLIRIDHELDNFIHTPPEESSPLHLV